MKGKLYIMGAPACIFSGLRPDIAERVVYLSDAMRCPRGWLKRVTRGLFAGRMPLPRRLLKWWFPAEDFDRLMEARDGDGVLLYEWVNARVLGALMSCLPRGVTWHIYYCNPIDAIFRDPPRALERLSGLGAKLSSFDAVDARRYGIAMTGQFFRYVDTAPATADGAMTDCFFCGLPKDRRWLLDTLRGVLERQGCTCDFIIPGGGTPRIPYDEYLHRLARSRCVVDICQSGQTGLTRRPLEAVFFGKKLITNNALIRTFDFYNPENVFIFGAESEARLADFVRTPAVPVPEEILDKYDVNGWVSQFMD